MKGIFLRLRANSKNTRLLFEFTCVFSFFLSVAGAYRNYALDMVGDSVLMQ